ncbi:hypothetical protein ACFDTO_31185 [Microbacteriaceae bacterium 4G12]
MAFDQKSCFIQDFFYLCSLLKQVKMSGYSFIFVLNSKIQNIQNREGVMFKIGDVFTWERTFTEEDVLQFGKFTGDQGRHHVEYDEKNRLMVHGLLTASIGTKIGGDLNYIARELVSEFIRPVFTRDTITCEATLTNLEQMEGFKKVAIQSVYRNQNGKEVMIGSSHGIIRD